MNLLVPICYTFNLKLYVLMILTSTIQSPFILLHGLDCSMSFNDRLTHRNYDTPNKNEVSFSTDRYKL